jgi:hypothetical protein
MSDIASEVSVRHFVRMLAGGLSLNDNPVFFTTEREAEIEAFGRMTAMRASQAIARSGAGSKLDKATHLEIYGAKGELLFEAELPKARGGDR